VAVSPVGGGRVEEGALEGRGPRAHLPRGESHRRERDRGEKIRGESRRDEPSIVIARSTSSSEREERERQGREGGRGETHQAHLVVGEGGAEARQLLGEERPQLPRGERQRREPGERAR
jgi:hypothetical protein